MDKVKAIFIEGAEGVGKSSQIMLLKMHLLDKQDVEIITFPYHERYLSYSPEELLEEIRTIREKLSNSNKLFIFECSIVRSIINETIISSDFKKTMESYRPAIVTFNELCKDFNLLHILIKPIEREKDIADLYSGDIETTKKRLEDFYNTVDLFEKNQYYRALKWQIVEFKQKDTMLDVLEKIKKYLK